MVNIDGRLEEIKRMVDRGEYFAVNRARQYGKTTTLSRLARKLSDEYIVFLSALKEWKMLFMKRRHPFASVSAVFYTVSCGIMKT